jgi:hypothetical protein
MPLPDFVANVGRIWLNGEFFLIDTDMVPRHS